MGRRCNRRRKRERRIGWSILRRGPARWSAEPGRRWAAGTRTPSPSQDRVGADGPAMHLHELLAEGEPQSGALRPPTGGAVHLTELLKQLGHVVRLDPDALVGHRHPYHILVHQSSPIAGALGWLSSGTRVRTAASEIFPPSPVNLEALDRRLNRICRMRPPSARSRKGCGIEVEGAFLALGGTQARGVGDGIHDRLAKVGRAPGSGSSGPPRSWKDRARC